MEYDRWAFEVVDYSRLKIWGRTSRRSKTIFEFDSAVENKFEVCLLGSKTIFEVDYRPKNVVDDGRPQLRTGEPPRPMGVSSRAHENEKWHPAHSMM
jgi:hypothetical protein